MTMLLFKTLVIPFIRTAIWPRIKPQVTRWIKRRGLFLLLHSPVSLTFNINIVEHYPTVQPPSHTLN